ncbi:MAG: acyltransferase, partial [Cytophagales bacterium]|nr:acyltransferase [Cytophagales bacterium]
RTVISNPIGLLLVTGVFIAEALLLQPDIYEMYAMTWHGFFLGLIAFMFGFCFVLTGHPFWKMIYKWKWLFLVSAISLYLNRLFQNQIQGYTMLMVVESTLWVYSILAFGFKYLNYSNRALRYLNQAAYPVYVVHMIFLFLASLVIFPLALNPYLKFTLVLLATCLGSLASYEFVIKRVKVLRPLFGLKTNL